MKKLVILGGSSPFTTALVDALSEQCESIPPMSLMLLGRNRANLNLIVRYAQYNLARRGWKIQSTTEWSEALIGADIVINQIRYGGLELREKSEAFCTRFGLITDETLGVAALYTALRLVPYLRETLHALARFSPKAYILNLTNPLSCVTGFIADEIEKCFGLCELPRHTINEFAKKLEMPVEEIEWSYCGLNHRGFIYSIYFQGRALLHGVSNRLGDRKISGIAADCIADLKAIPLKYFRLVIENQTLQPSRAQFLSKLREAIILELCSDIRRSPPSLNQRYTAWYPLAVVPMIAALQSHDPTEQIINIQNSDGIVQEEKAMVSKEGIHTVHQRKPPSKVAFWLRKYRHHERAFLKAMREPSAETIQQTLAADPIVPQSHVGKVSAILWREFETEQGSKSGKLCS